MAELCDTCGQPEYAHIAKFGSRGGMAVIKQREWRDYTMTLILCKGFRKEKKDGEER